MRLSKSLLMNSIICIHEKPRRPVHQSEKTVKLRSEILTQLEGARESFDGDKGYEMTKAPFQAITKLCRMNTRWHCEP